MTSRSRFVLLLVSAPIIVLVVIGGFLSKASAREGSYQHLRVFEDVVSLILNNYVEEVQGDNVMRGAMHGLAEGLDPDSAYLTPAQATAFASAEPLPAGTVGLELTRQYYLRVLAARDDSPAARAGLRTGDFIRSIDDQPTRDMSVPIGMRLLRGAPGSTVTLTVIRGSAAEPHTVTLARERLADPPVTSRVVSPGVGLVRVPAFTAKTGTELRQRILELQKAGATDVLVDVRGTAEGSIDHGVAAARLFVANGLITIRESREGRVPVEARGGDAALAAAVTVLLDRGTSGAAEVFAAALAEHKRATLVGERTIGRAAEQELIKLPDGSALWLSTVRYLTPGETAIHQKGLTPEVPVEVPEVEFGAQPTADPVVERAIEHLRKAAA
jgi:carboxyl-terminal processing protease